MFHLIHYNISNLLADLTFLEGWYRKVKHCVILVYRISKTYTVMAALSDNTIFGE